MSRWFRYYDTALDNLKVQQLGGDMFKTWSNLLCLASQCGGVLPSINDVAFRLRISAQDAQQRVDDLILAQLLDIRPDGKIEPHNWTVRQRPSDDSKKRTRKWRKKKADNPSPDNSGDGHVTVTVTASDGDGDAPDQNQTRTDKIRDSESVQIQNARAHDATNKPQRSEQIFDLEFDLADLREALDVETRELIAFAEGLGLPIETMLRQHHRTNPRRPAAYFAKLCKTELVERLPAFSPELLAGAIAGDKAARRLVMRALLEEGVQ